ncbi:MAG: hypothetical protein IID46_13375, partial [Planctomycetes bacterium]|nr:hypothetical protein [Planctomycetota bacterium]
ILHNYAVLCDLLAIELEEQGQTKRSHSYWQKSCKLWNRMINGNSTSWDSFVHSFNGGRAERDRVKPEDLNVVRRRVAENACRPHVGFGKVYASSDSVVDVRRHVVYATEIGLDGKLKSEFANDLVEEAKARQRSGNNAGAVLLAELAHEANPDDASIRETFAIFVFNQGIACANGEDVKGALKYLNKAEQINPNLCHDPDIARSYAKVFLLRASKQVDNGQLASADTSYSEAHRRFPKLGEDPEMSQALGHYFLGRAVQEIKQGHQHSAKVNLEKAIKFYPQILTEVEGLADFCRQLGVSVF